MSLKATITADMKTAMKSGDKARLGVIRMLQAAIKQREVDERIELDDAQVIAAIEKMIKQRRESVSQYRDGGRDDLADKEAAEIEVLEPYLPEQLSDAEIDAAVASAIAAAGAESMRDMGKVMGTLKAELAGKADMGKVSAAVKSKLAG
jgi:uncharacterized protein YqeY